MTGSVPRISVVVMGYRNEATIAEAVDSVLGQIGPDDAAEVIVVTSGGDGSGRSLAATHPGVRVVEDPGRLFPGGARNRGTAASTGAVIAYVAADCIAEPGWVQARLRAHDAGHSVVAGAMTAVPSRSPAAWASHLALFALRLPGRPPGLVTPPDPAAHGSSFDRSVLEKLGPFDELGRIGEDTDMAHRVVGADLSIWFEPAVRTAHRGPESAVVLMRGHYGRGRKAALDAGEDRLQMGAVRVAVGVVWFTLARTALALRTAWTYAPADRRRTVACIPWLVVAQASSAAGRGSVRRRRSGSRPSAPERANS